MDPVQTERMLGTCFLLETAAADYMIYKLLITCSRLAHACASLTSVKQVSTMLGTICMAKPGRQARGDQETLGCTLEKNQS